MGGKQSLTGKLIVIVLKLLGWGGAKVSTCVEMIYQVTHGDSLPALSRESKGKEAGEYSDAKIDGKDKLFTPILTKKNTFLVKKRFEETPGKSFSECS